ncbi:MAG TPA: anti-sigma F factor [Syntrophomonadaceae bacterium]|nr:anti-sigma F factor [Syntrophomonadaceae bacterium]
MNVKNYVQFEFPSLPENVAFARACVGAFVSQLDCTLDDLEEVKLVVSEAVSNSIIHGYNNRPGEQIKIHVSILDDRSLEIIIEDFGCGIQNLEQALEPAYSSEPGRMGLGFTFMKSFMDEMDIRSEPGQGTSVCLRRSFMHPDEEGFSEGG